MTYILQYVVCFCITYDDDVLLAQFLYNLQAWLALGRIGIGPDWLRAWLALGWMDIFAGLTFAES